VDFWVDINTSETHSLLAILRAELRRILDEASWNISKYYLGGMRESAGNLRV
jgi:hypothetical protein